jgi:hypothetical protein
MEDLNEQLAGAGFVRVGADGHVPLMFTNPLPMDVLFNCIARFGPQIHFHPSDK